MSMMRRNRKLDWLIASARRRTEGILREANQVIVDAESWADNRPDEEPLDVEDLYVIRDAARKCLERLNANDWPGFCQASDYLAELASG